VNKAQVLGLRCSYPATGYGPRVIAYREASLFEKALKAVMTEIKSMLALVPLNGTNYAICLYN